MRGDGLEQLAGDLVGIRVEEANPPQALDLHKLFEEEGQSVFQAEVFAVAGRVLADESDFADAGAGQMFGFGHHRFKAARAELASKLRDDAKSAGMIASLSNLDVGSVTRRCENPRSIFV